MDRSLADYSPRGCKESDTTESSIWVRSKELSLSFYSLYIGLSPSKQSRALSHSRTLRTFGDRSTHALKCSISDARRAVWKES